MKKLISLVVSIIIMNSMVGHNLHSKEYNIKEFCTKHYGQDLDSIKNDPLYDEQMPLELKKIKAFKKLQLCAPINYKLFVESLEKNSLANQKIIIFAMQSLTGDSYLNFIDQVLTKDKILNDEIVHILLQPGDSWNTDLIENYKSDRVKCILANFLNLLPEKKGYIDDLLSGNALEKLVLSRFNSKSPIHEFNYVTF